jgi:hypothetical protein
VLSDVNGRRPAVTLCPQALAVLRRQLALQARLERTSVIRHQHVFFRETGEPFRTLQIQARRWRATLTSLKLRYRRPYVARHSSVSWNQNPPVGREAAWPQHHHDAPCLCRLGGRHCRIRRRRHPALDASTRSAQADSPVPKFSNGPADAGSQRPPCGCRRGLPVASKATAGIGKSGSRSATRRHRRGRK